jgi:hypothetical protein
MNKASLTSETFGGVATLSQSLGLSDEAIEESLELYTGLQYSDANFWAGVFPDF